jgi:drug/metabolite transporter (DMT)-like permease
MDESFNNDLEIVGLDSFSGYDFIVYFSDDTYVTVTSKSLAAFFPDRIQIPAPEED